MTDLAINQHLIKIIGLLGEYPDKKRRKAQFDLRSQGFKEDTGSKELSTILKDVFYPDFRNLMFIKSDDKQENELLSRRFYLDLNTQLTFIKRDRKTKSILGECAFQVVKSEVFLFGEQIGLFAITLRIPGEQILLSQVSEVLNHCRNFDSEVQVDANRDLPGILWHEWISNKCLCGTMLRDDNEKIKADEFSGSKFKVFSVFDCETDPTQREHLLFDLGTSSPLGSASGIGNFAPHQEYYQNLMQHKISIFRNWESLCLFDSFTTIGNDFLDRERPKWEDTYFRIYLFRLFFKYNLYRYNSDLHDNTIKLRDQFEKFLNNYNLSHISFNFLPNEMFTKIGLALNLNDELVTFRERITAISNAIQEEKQSKMNLLLQGVTAISALGSIQPIIEGVSKAQQYLGWSNAQFYFVLSTVFLLLGSAVSYFLFTDFIKKMVKKLLLKKV
jgi:hypothetical protein